MPSPAYTIMEAVEKLLYRKANLEGLPLRRMGRGAKLTEKVLTRVGVQSILIMVICKVVFYDYRMP